MERFFFRETKSDKWHWQAGCPFFPDVQYPEIIKSCNFPHQKKSACTALVLKLKTSKKII